VQESLLPQEFRLEQNYPNPFNPRTTFRYQVPAACKVRLAVYDLLGREVARLVDVQKAPGTHEAAFDASALASGVYVYRLTAGDAVASRRMILMR
jgi:hypothetical protein